MSYSLEYEPEALADLVLGFLTSTQPTRSAIALETSLSLDRGRLSFVKQIMRKSGFQT
jgi:hypothetical protein